MHADTFVAGRNCLLLSYTERCCDVMPYSEDYEAKTTIPIVQVATGYTSLTGERYILIFSEAIWMLTLEKSLANPNQLRDYGILVQDNPYDGPMTIEKVSDEDDNFICCLQSEETNIFMETWTPIQADLESCRHIVLTSSHPWNPAEVKFPRTTDGDREEIENRSIGSMRLVDGEVMRAISRTYWSILTLIYNRSKYSTSSRLTPELLSPRWFPLLSRRALCQRTNN
mmetsp:Transcript_23475/g.35636  ORF Transcript_23475/g.35636 Transcript_23475/m.35636 type:complete len:227 (+) Transcript_23475:956-1636(+)